MTVNPARIAAAEAKLQKIPEQTLEIAIEYAGVPKPPTTARNGSIFLTQLRNVPDVFEQTMNRHGLTTQDFVGSTNGTGISPGDVHAAIQAIGIDAAREILDQRLEQAKLEGREPAKIQPSNTDKNSITVQGQMLAKFAQDAPAGYKMAHDYTVAERAQPGLQLHVHLEQQGIVYVDYIEAVRNSAKILEAMGRMPEYAQSLADKLPAQPEQQAPVVSAGKPKSPRM